MFQRLQAIRKRGFNLIEAAIVLGVVGAVIGGIWSAASSVIESHKVTRMSEALISIQKEANNLYRGVPPFSSSTDVTSAMISAGVVPADLAKGNSAITPWGTPLIVMEDFMNCDGKRLLVMVYYPSASVCTRLIRSVFMSDKRYSSGVSQIGFKPENININTTTPEAAYSFALQHCPLNTYIEFLWCLDH